jgi:hypothetical protein
MNSLAASTFRLYFGTTYELTSKWRNWPRGPFGRSARPMSSKKGTFWSRAAHQTLAPFNVAATVSARNARLFDESSQPSPDSSNVVPHASFIALTAAIVSGVLIATRPLWSTSWPP